MAPTPLASKWPIQAGLCLSLFDPEPNQPTNGLFWLINGYPAVITVWTAVEWEMDPSKPADAKLFPGGIRARLRMA